MNPRIKSVKYKSPYRLVLSFLNGEIKEFNLTPYLEYPVFDKLNDESFCRKARVAYGTVLWDDDTDFDPDTLYLSSTSIDA